MCSTHMTLYCTSHTKNHVSDCFWTLACSVASEKVFLCRFPKKCVRSAPPSRAVTSLLVAAFPIFSDPRRMAILPPDLQGLGGLDFFDFWDPCAECIELAHHTKNNVSDRFWTLACSVAPEKVFLWWFQQKFVLSAPPRCGVRLILRSTIG